LPLFADRGTSFEEARETASRFERARRALAVHRSSRPRDSTIDFARRVVELLDTAR
jgi:hypothetical protein